MDTNRIKKKFKKSESIRVVKLLFYVIAVTVISILLANISHKEEVSENKRQLTQPRINTWELKDGTVGEEYNDYIFVSAPVHTDMEITVDFLPDDLKFGYCDKKTDVEIIPKPNTLYQCVVYGTPNYEGNYDLYIKAVISDGRLETQKVAKLRVNP